MTKAEHREMGQIMCKIKRGIQAVQEERAEKIQREGRLAKAPGGGTERRFNSGHDSHGQKRLAYPWTKPGSTYAHLLKNPTCQPALRHRLAEALDVDEDWLFSTQVQIPRGHGVAERQLIKKLEQLVQKSNRRNRNPAYFDLLQDLRCADPTDRHKAWFLHERIINVLEDRTHKPLTQGQRHYLRQLERRWRARSDNYGTSPGETNAPHR